MLLLRGRSSPLRISLLGVFFYDSFSELFKSFWIKFAHIYLNVFLLPNLSVIVWTPNSLKRLIFVVNRCAISILWFKIGSESTIELIQKRDCLVLDPTYLNGHQNRAEASLWVRIWRSQSACTFSSSRPGSIWWDTYCISCVFLFLFLLFSHVDGLAALL